MFSRYTEVGCAVFPRKSKVLPTLPPTRRLRGQSCGSDAFAVRDHVSTSRSTTSLKHAVNSVYCHNNLSNTCADLAHGLKCGRDPNAVVDEAKLLHSPRPTAYRSAHCHSSSNGSLRLPCLSYDCFKLSERRILCGLLLENYVRCSWRRLVSFAFFDAEPTASPTLLWGRLHPLRERTAHVLRKTAC
jgi:hypothetical protein